MAEAYRIALEKGLPITEPIGFGLCTLKKEASFVIDPVGNIFKCLSGVGREEFKVGTIYDKPINLAQKISQFAEIKTWETSPKCKRCKYLPLCAGGCREQALAKWGDIGRLDCLKSFMDSWLREAVKVSYQLYQGISPR